MLHIRVIAPADRSAEISDLLTAFEGTTNVIVLSGAARQPVGDVIMCDVTREAASGVLEALRSFDVGEIGSIAVENIDISLSHVAELAQAATPGYEEDAVVWEELADHLDQDSRLGWVFISFLVIATMIASIAVLLDSTVMIVGAMVLGPEFGPIAGICFGAITRNFTLVATALRTFVTGFAIAIAVACLGALVARGLGWIDGSMLAHNQEMTFITDPDRWSFIVALLAGVAGVLSITGGKSSALVGVFISVATVPAAGAVAVALGLGQWGELGGPLLQFGLNVTALVLAGLITLMIQRVVWSRYGMRLGRPAHHHHHP